MRWRSVTDRQEGAAAQGDTFSSIYADHNLAGPSFNFYYQHAPAMGFTCFYRPRNSNELHYDVARIDSQNPYACPNAAAVLAAGHRPIGPSAHAAERP